MFQKTRHFLCILTLVIIIIIIIIIIIRRSKYSGVTSSILVNIYYLVRLGTADNTAVIKGNSKPLRWTISFLFLPRAILFLTRLPNTVLCRAHT
jgi:hypothetical protein